MGRGEIRDWLWRLLAIAIGCVLAAGMPPAVSRAATAATADQGPTDVELPTILAPMIVDTRLEGYAYITVALSPATRDKTLTIRQKVPFLQDAFLRELNKGAILKAGDPKSLDVEGVTARLTMRMNEVLPAGTVTSLKLSQIVLAQFRS